MQYMGGKFYIRKELCNILNLFRKPGQVYFDPFVGAGWVIQGMGNPRMASDGCKALITMYNAVQGGWEPPSIVSEDLFQAVRYTNDHSDPLLAFCQFGCTFGGIWNGGYARAPGTDRNYADEASRGLLKQKPLLQGVTFMHKLFHEHDPHGMLIYCDPPYAGTAGYKGVPGKFDHELFWNIMRIWSLDNTVLISEYQAPEDFMCVAEFSYTMGLRSKSAEGTKNATRIERLFMYGG